VRRNARGSVLTRAPHPGLNYARVKLDRLTDRPGVLLEDKGLGLAVHYRKAPDAEEAVIRNCRAIAETTGLVLQLGRMVAELRTPGADKGESVRAFMAEPPFAGATPVFVGDDLTDEDGFAAAAELGGYGVLVGETRDTAAHHGLSDVEAVLGWLGALA
jgi:trehalose 6-phosphate phosphatase